MWPFKKSEDKKENNRAISVGALGGLGEILYCYLVVLFIGKAEKIFSPVKDNQLVGTLVMLILLVFSVGVSGLVVFGYPAWLVLQQKFRLAILAAVSALVVLALGFWVLILSFLV